MKIDIELYDTTYQTLIMRLAEKDFNSIDDLYVLSHEAAEEITSALFEHARKHYDEISVYEFIDMDLTSAHQKILKERYDDDIYHRDMQLSYDKDRYESMRG